MGLVRVTSRAEFRKPSWKMVVEYSWLPLEFIKCDTKHKKIYSKTFYCFYWMKTAALQNELVKLHQEKHLVFLDLKAQWRQLAFRENEMLEALEDFTDVGILSFVCIFEIMQLKKASC